MADMASCKLFVGGLSAMTTTEALRHHFSKYGRVVDAIVMSKNSRPRGFGFVTFDGPAPATMALTQPQRLDGRIVDVKRAVPGEKVQERASNKIFVGGLPQDVTTDDLRAYFASYGHIADAVVMVDRKTHRSRGFGFIRFATGAAGCTAAEAALRDFSLHQLGGKWVEVKPAAPAALLQEFSSNGVAEETVNESEHLDWLAMTLAYSEQTMEGTPYVAEQSAWDSNCLAYGGGTGMTIDSAGFARLGAHARGRRGRRRKQRADSGFSGSDWPGHHGYDMDYADGGEESDEDDEAMFPGGSAWRPTPQVDEMALAAASVAAWGGAMHETGRNHPVYPAPGLSAFTSWADPVLTEDSGSAGAICGAAAKAISRPGSAGSSEATTTEPADPNRAHELPSAGRALFLKGLAPPMKIDSIFGSEFQGFGPAQAEDGKKNKDRREGVSKEEFLSLEVRPWLAAC